MARIMCVAVLVSLAACASGGGGGAGGMATLEMLRLAGSREANPPRDGSEAFVVDTLALPAAAVFPAVRGAYEEFGIPFTFYEADQLRLGGFVERLGDLDEDTRPSTWVDCGRGITAQPYADAYQVSMAVATRVVALDEATSTVETVIRARARARDVSAELLRCSSFGTFEGRIADLVRADVMR